MCSKIANMYTTRQQVYLPGDIILTRGNSLLARAIRICSRSWGEARTEVNHSGVVVTSGQPINSPRGATVIEAMRKVLWRPLAEHTSPIIIFRPMDLTPEQLEAIAERALSYNGRTYGYGKIVLHFLDWCLGGAYLFRRLGRMARYPICSWVVADAYFSVGESFGVSPGQAQPDDIYDYCMEHWEKYRVVHPLLPL